MRNAPACPLTSPATRFSAKWVVTVLLGLFSVLLCISPHAAVNKSETDRPLPAKSKKGKTRKATAKKTKTEDANQHWQKKQPFAAISSNDTKIQAPAKQTTGNTKQNIAEYRVANKYLPESGKTWENGRSVKLASSVFTKKANSLPSVHVPGNPSVFKAGLRESRTVNEDNNGYTTGPARFSVSYEKSQDTAGRVSRFMSGKNTPDIATNYDIVETRQNQPNLQLGMEYATGNGRVNASVNYVKLKETKGTASGTTGMNNNDSTDLKTIAIGYTYDVSNKTSFYGMVARTDYEREAIAGYMRGNGSDEDSVTGVQFGMTHKF